MEILQQMQQPAFMQFSFYDRRWWSHFTGLRAYIKRRLKSKSLGLNLLIQCHATVFEGWTSRETE
jgi:hypothetical protein